MKPIITAILIAIILTSCGFNNSDHKARNNKETEFEQFVASIPLLALPFELSTNEEIKHISLQSNFIPDGAALVGRLKSRNDTHLIIYSYPADIRLPILEVYNKEGEKLNKMQLFAYGTCPLTSNGYSKCEIKNNEEIYIKTACDLYDSRVDIDTISVEKLLQNN